MLVGSQVALTRRRREGRTGGGQGGVRPSNKLHYDLKKCFFLNRGVNSNLRVVCLITAVLCFLLLKKLGTLECAIPPLHMVASGIGRAKQSLYELPQLSVVRGRSVTLFDIQKSPYYFIAIPVYDRTQNQWAMVLHKLPPRAFLLRAYCHG